MSHFTKKLCNQESKKESCANNMLNTLTETTTIMKYKKQTE
jgi:hypothetical protein